ncbi:MAG: universal stress protein, partial [Bacteroidota bacterium]
TDKFNSRLHCLHIETKDEQSHHAEVTQKMETLKKTLEAELETAVLMELVQADKVVQGLEKYVETHEPNLLVMHHKTHSFFERALKGKTKAQRAARTLEVPLMILNN